MTRVRRLMYRTLRYAWLYFCVDLPVFRSPGFSLGLIGQAASAGAEELSPLQSMTCACMQATILWLEMQGCPIGQGSDVVALGARRVSEY